MVMQFVVQTGRPPVAIDRTRSADGNSRFKSRYVDVQNLGARMEQPVRSLNGFDRVTLKPGESTQICFNLGFPELSFYNNAGKAVIEPMDYTVWGGGSSTAEAHDEFRITP